MLQGMIHRGATIFLTSHVLEIVERLCTHVAIINKGSLVAQGSLKNFAPASKPSTSHRPADPDGGTHTGKATLEDIFLNVLGTTGAAPPEQGLSWLA